MKLNRQARLLAAVAAALALPASAMAASWPNFGGDGGRSGHQPVGAGTPPLRSLYSLSDPSDRNVVTSVLATSGAVGRQRAAYGTADGRVHLRILESGAPVGPPAGIATDDGAADRDVFGDGPGTPAPATVSFLDTSTPGRLGQLLVVHNDDDESADGDISVAQIDVANGSLVKQHSLDGTAGFSIRSAPVATAPDAAGGRILFFVAAAGDDERLFRVPVTAAGSSSASFGAVTTTADVDADAAASPTIIWLRDAAGNPSQHVALGSGPPASAVKTFAVSDLGAGPVSADLGDSVRTPAVPVQPDGSIPSPAGPVHTAPVVYAAARVGGGTIVHRLVQPGNAQALAVTASSPALGGLPAPGLATDVLSATAGPSAGRVVVTTGQNLYLLDGVDMAPRATLSASALNAGTSGFGQTTAAVGGGFAYATSDDGDQVVIRIADGAVAGSDAFAENPVNSGPRAPRSAFGQPALSRSFVQFASQKGVFVYVTRCGNTILGTPGADRIIGTAAGEDVRVLGGDDRVSAASSDDCLFGGPGDDALSGNAGNDEVTGEDGNDRVYGRSGDDVLSGSAGGDRMRGGGGSDLVQGNEDDDQLFGDAGRDVVRGAVGDDRILGGGDDDAVSGNSGEDRVSGGAGADRVFGRAGDDGASGNSGDDRVSAGSGDDRVYGRSGADGVSGNTGDDLVDAGSGEDRLFGRRGDDLLDARDGERDIAYCGPGRDTVRADRHDVLRGCERVFRR